MDACREVPQSGGKREKGKGIGWQVRSGGRFLNPVRHSRGFCFVGAISCLILLACGGSGKGKTAYIGATVIDGSGAPPMMDAVIIVAGGHIEAIGPPDLVRVPRGAAEVRLDGKWVIPGLIDAHAHTARWTLTRFLAYGVTSVRSMGEPQDTGVALRESVSLGSLAGPRLYISGPILDSRAGTGLSIATLATATDARRAVDERVLIDAAQVKVYAGIDRTLLAPLLDEAKALEIPVAAHLGRVDAITAARMGVNSLEHMTGVVEATVRDPTGFYRAHGDFFAGWNMFERAWAGLDSAGLDRTARALAETGVAIVPTLVLHETFAHLSDQEFAARLDLSGVPQSVRDEWNVPDLIRRANLSEDDFLAFRSSRAAQNLFVRLFRRAQGIVAAGSDAPNQLLAPGVSLHDELALLVEAGLSPEDALLAATRNAAQLVRADSIGVLRNGSVADFVVLSADPLADIANTRSIETVVFKGHGYRPDELRSGW